MFQNLARSKKRPGPAHDAEVAEGQDRQEAMRALLGSLAEVMGGEVVRDREAFVETLNAAAKAAGLRLSAPERKVILAAHHRAGQGASGLAALEEAPQRVARDAERLRRARVAVALDMREQVVADGVDQFRFQRYAPGCPTWRTYVLSILADVCAAMTDVTASRTRRYP